MTTRQQSILIGAVVTGVLSTSYLGLVNFVCCLGGILGGVVAVQQFTLRSGTRIDSGDGAILGAVAAAIGAVIGGILDALLRPFGLDSNTIVRRVAEQQMDPTNAQEEMAREMMAPMEGWVGLLATVFVALVIMAVYSVFGAIGGALGTAFFEGDADRPATSD